MGNNFGTKNGRLLAQMVLSNLMVHPMFSAISTNFSGAHNGQRLKFGQDVDVRLITAGTVDDWTEAAGYEASDSADTNATVNINQHKHISRNLTVEEAFGRDGTVLADYAAVDANALANEVMTDLIGVVKAPGIAIGDQKSIIALGAFGHDAAVDVNGELDDRDVTDVGRFGVVTGKSRRGLKAILDGHELADHFVTLRTADDCPSKPHPAMVLECCDEVGIMPNDTVVIGDATFDMQMAQNAKAASIGVNWGYASVAELQKSGANKIIKNPLEIIDIVR